MLVPYESHHIGCGLGIVDILTVLYFDVLKINPKNPKDPKRDIFILSKGHGAAAVYATLFEKGFFSKKLLLTYDQNGGKLPEHASITVPGVEVSTGSLGHGLPIGIGYAVSFSNDKKKNQVAVILSDGELNEGSNWEAFMFAGHHNLSNLTAIIDANGFQGYSTTEKVLDLSPLSEKFKAFRWNVYKVNGNDIKALQEVFAKIKKNKNGKPNCIIAKTVKGKGIPFFEGKFESHYKSVDEKTKQEIFKNL
jgi:transketolase